MMIRIPMPTNSMRNDASSFDGLSRLHEELQTHTGERIELDWQHVTWFDAHLSAPLRIVILHSAIRGNTFQLAGLRPEVGAILKKNGLLKQKLPDIHGTTIPVRAFHPSDSREFAQYTKKSLSRPEMPRMTPQLRVKLHEGIDELFANSSMHSDTELKIVAAGQFYPAKKLLTMSISDGGIGIVGSLRKVGLRYRNHVEAIDWAMNMNNTSKRGDIPGGLGLSVLRNFVSANQGKLLVVSAKGYWCQNGGRVESETLPVAFPGTSVILEINTADKKAYELKTTVRATEIW